MGKSLEGQNNGDKFGSSVDLSSKGDILAISGPENGTFGPSSGHARVMRFDGSQWIQVGSDIGVVSRTSGENLGMDVSLSSNGSRIALGAPFANYDGLYIDLGQVVVFQVEEGYII